MSSATTTWILQLKDQISNPLKDVDGAAKTSAIDLLAVAEAARRIQTEFNAALEPGIKFESGLADVKAITNATDTELAAMSENARKSAKTFGVDATAGLNNYKTILSKLGPDIGKNQEALNSMSNSALVLSKTMGGDTNAAVNALTTSMLQFRTDLSDPIKAAEEMDRMLNVMAAGAQLGSSEIPQMAKAIEVSGVAMDQAKISFEAGNAALQELARGGKEGAEGGIALRNVLGKMAGADVIPKEALNKLKAYGVDMGIVSNKTLPFTDRLRELAKAQGDATVFAQVFGVENAAAAQILVRSTNEQDALREAITGTNVAYDQADIVMNTYAEKQKRITSWIDDMKISLFNVTKGFVPFINVGLGAIMMLANLKNVSGGVTMLMNTKLGMGLKKVWTGFRTAGIAALNFSKNLLTAGLSALKASGRFVITALTGIGSFITSIITATAATWGFNIALSANPIGLIVIGIAAVIAIIVLLVKYWDDIKAAIAKFAQWVWENNPFRFLIDLVDKIFPGFKEKVTAVFEHVKELALKFWEKIKEVWSNIKSFFGFGDDETKELEVTHKKEKGSNTPDLPEEDPAGNLFEIGGSTTNKVTQTDNKAGKIITMNLNIQNSFAVTGDKLRNNVDDIADQLIGRLVDGLRDGVIALD